MEVDGRLVSLGDHLKVFTDAINVGVILGDNSCTLVDFGPGNVLEEIVHLGARKIEMINFTHHHRDQACGALRIQEETEIAVPEDEEPLFDDVSSYWGNPDHRWHLYNFHPHHLTLAEPLRVDRTYREGDVVEWGPATVSVLSTPGHTDGSISYVVDLDGQRTVFCGDLMFDEGRVWEIHSLQKGTATTDYHGFMGSRGDLITSLQKISDTNPTKIVPSHGAIIRDPHRAIDALVKNLNSCYDRYASTSSLRHYFPHLFQEYLEGPTVMPIKEGLTPPSCLRHIGTSWLLSSMDGACFAMDCGAPSVVDEVKKLRDSGDVSEVEALWITHYHDDHVDAAPAFGEEFGCPITADSHVADVIEDPLAWRIPCISPVRVAVDRRTRDSESWTWHEFRMTAYHLPGQTLYSGGLLIEGQGHRMLFSGDSFTPGGIDDHCCGNRNLLGKGLGYDRCLGLLRRLKPDLIFNSHVDVAFKFSSDQLAFLDENLAARKGEYGRLIAWDDPNYGMDEHWARCFPYEQRACPGDTATLDVVITNHSRERRDVGCRPVPPSRWKDATTSSHEAQVAPGDEASIPLSIKVPRNVEPGRYVVPVDIRYGSLDLPQFTEAIIEI